MKKQSHANEEDITEYRASYSWKARPTKTNDYYEKIIQNRIENPDTEKKKEDKSSKFTDPYEVIVARKMQGSEKKKEEQEKIKEICKETSPKQGKGKETQKQQQKKDDEISISSHHSEDSQIESPRRKPRKTAGQQKRKPKITYYDDSHLNKNAEQKNKEQTKISSSTHKKITQPVFFKSPEEASQEQQKSLYGPFYVSWPLYKEMPPGFEALAKKYGRRKY